MRLYLASTNRAKLREFSAGGRAHGILVERLPNLDRLPQCVEDGATFEENARKKALHYSATAEGLILGEDSGLSVDALGGAPGIFSARFAGFNADARANNRQLLGELQSVPAQERSAHYVCVIAMAERGSLLTIAQGRVDGLILDSPRGSGGFGYDPLFFYPPLSKTFAELSPEEKFRVSHRGEAFRKLLEYLKSAHHATGRPPL